MSAAVSVAEHKDGVWNVDGGRDRSSSAGTGLEDPRVPDAAYLPRSASYTYFPRVKDSLFEDSSVVELKGRISEDELSLSNPSNGEDTSSGGTSPENEAPILELNIKASRRTSRIGNFLLPKRNEESNAAESKVPSLPNRSSIDGAKSRSPARSLSKLRRKSWISSASRSSSPEKAAVTDDNQEETKGNRPSVGTSRRKSFIGRSRDADKDASKTGSDASSISRRESFLSKKPKRPLSVLLRTLPIDEITPPPRSPSRSPRPRTPTNPPVPALPKSFSTDRLPSLGKSQASSERIPPLPRNFSSEKLKSARPETPKKKDELWSVFRTLDGDFQKFQSKSIALKANVVRTALLPFLRNYASHSSNRKLRPEDLDRRANILNRWWTGLLEMVAGRNNQSISGTDRPVILEGISGIMERPEWRVSPSPFCPLSDRPEAPIVPKSVSTSSLATNESDFLAESVYHNVRNIFIQNLIAQMSFVVEKMSLRNAAASLVTFCGKTCAYAFFFCPAVANVMVRLWNPSLKTMKRVLEESGISRMERVGESFKQIIQAFPPHLHALGFTSLSSTVRMLRRPTSLPLGTAGVQWHGPWMKRWSGSESDLFYVFVKYFHILATDFLPAGTLGKEVLATPGMLIVHSQILVNLDATIYRNTAPHNDEPGHGPSSITFDDVLSAPDASASTLPIPPTNATRLMAENRIIMLVRDFLSERSSHVSVARHMFAQTFSRLLRASARQIPIYDHNACYTLCDFLEEALIILVRYEQANPAEDSVLDWPFWLSVCRQMTESHNTTTEIRLYAFLYSIWATVIKDKRWKAVICLEFLLEPEFFESRFNHWCPMVRAYFMRLLCWRIARYDEDAGEGEFEILSTLSERLRSVWSHFAYLREEAASNGLLLPSTAPCNPAPSRRLLIIRTDAPIAAASASFLSFDNLISPTSPSRVPASPKSSILSAIPESTSRPISASSDASSDFGQSTPEPETGKRRWNLLRNLISGPKARAKSRSPGPASRESKVSTTTPTKASDPVDSVEKPVIKERPIPPPVLTHRTFCFRFSLEWVDKRFANPGNARLFPPRLPGPAQQYLQAKSGPFPITQPVKPEGVAAVSSRYAGRSLAEWVLVVNECQNFFERRKNEGVPANKWVETPTLGVEVFRRPG